MKTTNPVLGRFATAGHQSATGYDYPQQLDRTGRDVMTIDDVVVKTVSLIGTTVVAAAATWILVPDRMLGAVWISAAIIGLILGLVISFAQITNPVLLFTYAIVEGAFLGAVSEFYETLYRGIVVQAVVATLSTFLVMAGLYKARIIRATPKFAKILIGAVVGLVVAMLVNLVIGLVSGGAGPLRDGGPLAIVFSLICIVVAALMFVLNFAQIEEGVAAGLPRKYGWLGAFGILVELVWLYLEFLRLISYFQED